MNKQKYYTFDEANYKYDELRRDLYDGNISIIFQDIDKDHNITRITMHYNIASRLEEDDSWTLEPILILQSNSLTRDITEPLGLQLELVEPVDKLMDVISTLNFSNIIKNKIKSEVRHLKNRLNAMNKNYYIKGLL